MTDTKTLRERVKEFRKELELRDEAIIDLVKREKLALLERLEGMVVGKLFEKEVIALDAIKAEKQRIDQE